MTTDKRTSAAAPDTLGLRRAVARLRRRARAVLLAGAVVAALAADVWYEVLSFWFFRFFHVRIWFPLFFLVAFAAFAAAVARRTRTLRFSAALDGRFALKERLASAFRFERLPGVPADLREAQARETLRAVDFGRLRSSFRFRPWRALAFLVTGAGFTGWLMYRHPESFNPRSVVFRQGRVVFVAVKSLGDGRDGAGTRGGGSDAGPGGSAHPQVALVQEKGSPGKEPSPGEQSGRAPDKKPPSGKEKNSGKAPEPRKKPPEHPEISPDRKPPDQSRRGEGKGARLGPNEGGALGRSASLEETDGVSAPTERPESGLAAGVADLRGPDTALPTLPFVRLFGVGASGETLFDPETLNIVLEAYPPKYREHLESYLKALQALGEKRTGS